MGQRGVSSIIVVIVVVVIIAAGAIGGLYLGTRNESQGIVSASVSITPSSQNGTPGSTLTYTVTVNNTGNVSDTYSFGIHQGLAFQGPLPSIQEAKLVVGAGSSRNATLSVPIPSDAISGSTCDVTVKVISQANYNTVIGSVSCTAQALVKTSPPNLSVIVTNDYHNYTAALFGIEVLNQGGSAATISRVFLEQTGNGGGYYTAGYYTKTTEGGYQTHYAPITVEPQSTAWVYVQLDFYPDTAWSRSIVCQLMDSSGNVLYSNNSLSYNEEWSLP